MAAEGMQSHDQSRGNCPTASHPATKKGRINAPILPKPARCAKSDRLLVSGLDDGSPVAQAIERMVDQEYEPPPEDKLDEACESIYRQLAGRRTELMALLKLAIDRNEPLRISG